MSWRTLKQFIREVKNRKEDIKWDWEMSKDQAKKERYAILGTFVFII